MNKPILSVSLFVKVTRGWNVLFFCRVCPRKGAQYFRAISSLCPYEEGSGPRRRDSRRRESTIRQNVRRITANMCKQSNFLLCTVAFLFRQPLDGHATSFTLL